MELEQIDNLSESSNSIFNISGSIDANEYPRNKQIRWWLLTYLARNYKRIIAILLIFILLLFVIIFVLIYFVSQPTIVKDSVDEERTLLSVLACSTKSPVDDVSFDKLPCGRINCRTEKSPCEPLLVDYRSMRIMACCSCFPTGYRMIRYDEDEKKNVYFEVPTDLAIESDYDLITHPQIHQLRGTWSIIVESGHLLRLKYGNIHIEKEHSSDDDDGYQKSP